MSPKEVRQEREVTSAGGGRWDCIFKCGGCRSGRVLKERKECALQILRGTVFQA